MSEPVTVLPFADLTGTQVYGLLKLRSDVFVVEQECPYPEIDGRDTEPATEHLWFDADGAGAGAAVMVADLQSGATLTSEQILLV